MVLRGTAVSTRTVGSRQFDVCIVGAGVAGITLAMELRGSGLDVCLLEGGTHYPDARSQRLYSGLVDGLYDPELDTCRARALGGSSNLWPGTCTPLDPIDFEQRAANGELAWPFGYEDIAPYYERAAHYCAVKTAQWEPNTDDPRPFLTLDPGIWEARRAQVSMALSWARFEPDLDDAENVTVLLGTSAVRIECTPSGERVRQVLVRSGDGEPFAVRARSFVLAMGGIENARMLLVSNDHHAEGLGNASGLVGRCFMEHPVIHSVVVDLAAPMDASRYVARAAGGASELHYVQLRDAYIRAHDITNVRVHFAPASLLDTSPAMFAYRYLRLSMRRRRAPQALARRLTAMAGEAPALGAFAVSRLGGTGGARAAVRQDRLQVSIMCEQLPDPDNRITLLPERDAYGLPRAQLRWRMSDLEQERAHQAIELLAESFRDTGLGRLRYVGADPRRPFEERLGFGNHAIGTTRASTDPRTGVVDGDGRVFGVDNLFITGSSIFPTSGHLPPTLTIAALAVRLAAHLTGAPARLADARIDAGRN